MMKSKKVHENDFLHIHISKLSINSGYDPKEMVSYLGVIQNLSKSIPQ